MSLDGTAGTAALDGTLNVCEGNGYIPDLGDTFWILTFGAPSGSFATINMDDRLSGRLPRQ